MTDKSQASGTGAVPTPELKPLPPLKVIRETYCSQEMTDSCIDYLVKNYPQRVLALLDEEKVNREVLYYKIASNIAYILKDEVGKSIDVPQTHLGLIDLVYELSRRLRRAYDLPEILPQGKPIAPTPDGPFPELIKIEIGPVQKKLGITQEVADRLLGRIYEQRPDLWYAMAEGARRNLHLYMLSDDFFDTLKRVGAEENIPLIDVMAPSAMRSLAWGCIYKMCEIPII